MTNRRTLRSALMAGAGALALSLGAMAGAAAQTQGVTDSEILIGTHQDLSGPISSWGIPVANGMNMAVDAVNEAGGINGRKLKLIVEDSGYDPKRAVLATQKLLTSDQVFAMVGQMGTPTVMAAMPMVLDANVPHLFPLTAAEQMYEPFHELKFSLFSPYFVQTDAGTRWFLENRGVKKVCAIHQDDEFGLNVWRGGEAALKSQSMTPVEVTTFKRGATDFSSQMARLKAAGCELVVSGTIVRETVGVMTEAKKIGFEGAIMGSSASFTQDVINLGKEAVEGFYSAGQTPVPYRDTASAEVAKWMDDYKAKFGTEANTQATAGWNVVMVTVEGLKNAGKDVTVESFVSGLEQVKDWEDMFGGPKVSFDEKRRLATEDVLLSQVKDGRWVNVAEGVQPYTSVFK